VVRMGHPAGPMRASMDPQALCMELQRLIETMPDLSEYPQPPETTQWFARAIALVRDEVDVSEAASLKDAMRYCGSPDQSPWIKGVYVRSVPRILKRALAAAKAA
jgi:hypothetical protein